jgi:hypothetical protein
MHLASVHPVGGIRGAEPPAVGHGLPAMVVVAHAFEAHHQEATAGGGGEGHQAWWSIGAQSVRLLSHRA